MTAKILVKQCGIDNFEWISINENDMTASGGELCVGDGERLREACQRVANSILLVAAEWVSLRTVHFEDSEKKLLRQTVPYSLEEECVSDVDSLHFALGATQQNTVPVALIAKEQMQAALHDVMQEDIELHQSVSELSFIPWQSNSWSLLISRGRWLVRVDEHKGFAMEAENAGFALQLLLDEADQLPEQLTIFYQGDDQVVVTSQLPELLKGIVVWRDADYWQAISEGARQAGPAPVNLLQGEFVRRLPWLRWWSCWKMAIVLFGLALLVHIVSSVVHVQLLKGQNLELRATIEQSYRQAVPKGAVIEPARQLRRKVNELKGGSGAAFMPLFDQVALAVAGVEGVSLQGLNYNEKQHEIRLTILAQGFNDVETVRAKLEAQGLTAKLTGSNAEGSQTRARIRVQD